MVIRRSERKNESIVGREPRKTIASALCPALKIMPIRIDKGTNTNYIHRFRYEDNNAFYLVAIACGG